MKLTAQEKVLEAVKQLEKGSNTVTAEQVAEYLSVTRQVASHYLTRLMEEGMVTRIPGKPVYWTTCRKAGLKEKNVFADFIGWNGSQADAVNRCKAAVKYPPNGLNILITGESGVGKSYLAKLIYQYSVQEKILPEKAPYMVLNCADYANNPELLSSVLFGYVKGAFTGAAGNKEGLISEADGGYLFLDEVHRLSRENQEKLFLFMDSGMFRPLGENRGWKHAKVRFIFATTEKANEVFLETFLRRIQTHVSLISYAQRPEIEKYQIIQTIYKQETRQIQKNIRVNKEVIKHLLHAGPRGNIGRIKNIIKQSCADAYCRDSDQEILEIKLTDVPSLLNEQKGTQLSGIWTNLQDMYIYADESDASESAGEVQAEAGGKLEQLIADCSRDPHYYRTFPLQMKELFTHFQKEAPVTAASAEKQLYRNMFRQLWNEVIQKKYGIFAEEGEIWACCELYMWLLAAPEDHPVIFPAECYNLERNYYRSWYVAEQFAAALGNLIPSRQKEYVPFLSMELHPYISEHISISGLLVAHGEKTASSIQEVVNHLCRTYIFEGIDMPVDTGIDEIILRVSNYIRKQAGGNGLILIIDTGSLNQLYSSIREFVKKDLLVIDNLTTSVALDIGLKIQGGIPFSEIAERAEKGYKIQAKYYEGFSKNQHIIISCMSGEGVSNKIKDMILDYIPPGSVELITMEYKELKTAISENLADFFANTMLVISTNDLPDDFWIPHINIYNILSSDGTEKMWSFLQEVMDFQQYQKMLGELLKFFSREGVADHLQFLNPVVVINEVETVLARYEAHYHFHIQEKLKLNLYMHLALMLERLLVNREPAEEEIAESEEERDFYYHSHIFFHDVEEKYNIHVSPYELSLLYELMSPLIVVFS